MGEKENKKKNIDGDTKRRFAMEDVRTEDKTGNQSEAFIFKLDYNQ